MEPIYWNTEKAHFNNSETMSDFLDTVMDETWEVITIDGSYAEVQTPEGADYEVHVCGNGDSNNHMARLIRINN